MADNTLETLYNAHSDQLASGKPAAAVLTTFSGSIPLAGPSLDTLQPLGAGGGGLAVAPGPVLGGSSSGEPAKYYLAFDDNTAERVLWFQINTNEHGHETIGASGWRDKPVH
ncbi:hypothetical protein H4R19_002964 [Coemansia spiralis]|nr:hypothetical protein H4R19_002964 [Coemansia spiralis]